MGMIANSQLKAARGPLLLDWRPEDPEFWARNGKRIASRNLWISIPALLLAFAVWMIWSTVTVRLNSAGFAFSNDQLFLLAALPSISGATLRVFYSFMVPIFGGRRWTALSTASMLIPCIWLGFAVQDPSTPYWVFALIALLCGFGGGNFASSMSNISFFYPKSQQGTALGLNAGLGNLGVSVMQFAVPLAVAGGLFGAFGGEPQQLGDGGRLWLQNAGWIWVPFIAVVSVAAWFGMNDIADAKASFRDQAVIFKRKHNWRAGCTWPPSARSSASRPASRCSARPSSPTSTRCNTPSSVRWWAPSAGPWAAGWRTSSAARGSPCGTTR